MGQQQLLLLVLGIVVVGVAVVIAIEDFDIQRNKARTDAEINKLLDLAAQAQTWKAKPALVGGGQNGNPADFDAFTVESIGLTPSGGPDGTPFVDMPGLGCFRFFPNDDELRINALNEDCVIGSWTKGISITGLTADDIELEFR